MPRSRLFWCLLAAALTITPHGSAQQEPTCRDIPEFLATVACTGKEEDCTFSLCTVDDDLVSECQGQQCPAGVCVGGFCDGLSQEECMTPVECPNTPIVPDCTYGYCVLIENGVEEDERRDIPCKDIAGCASCGLSTAWSCAHHGELLDTQGGTCVSKEFSCGPIADLEITKVCDDHGESAVGCTLTITNHGPDAAFDVVATDDLGAALTLRRDGRPCFSSSAGVGPDLFGIVEFPAGDLQSTEVTECGVTVRSIEPPRGELFANSASVTSQTFDHFDSNDSDFAVFRLGATLVAIPTLNSVGLLALTVLLLGAGILSLSRFRC